MYPEMGWKQKVFWIVLIVALVIGYGFLFTADCSAESAVVSFNDAEQLVAQVDSIVSCDSTALTFSTATMMQDGHIRWVTDTTGYLVITCRRLVCVTVVSHPVWDYPRYFNDDLPIEEKMKPEVTPGTAIITWKEVKK